MYPDLPGVSGPAYAAEAFSRLWADRAGSCLYADLDNPTSNSIYEKLGFKPVRDDVVVVFESA